MRRNLLEVNSEPPGEAGEVVQRLGGKLCRSEAWGVPDEVVVEDERSRVIATSTTEASDWRFISMSAMRCEMDSASAAHSKAPKPSTGMMSGKRSSASLAVIGAWPLRSFSIAIPDISLEISELCTRRSLARAALEAALRPRVDPSVVSRCSVPVGPDVRCAGLV